jgi:D-xylose transport system substrate-binding protein
MSGPVQRAALAIVAVIAALGVVACGSDSDDASSTTEAGGSSSGSTEALTAESFTSDFSAMEGLQDLAAEGKGKVAVLLPDTTSSARYESFDRPYLQQAFEAAGLTSDQYTIDNAQGSASTMQTQAEAAITDGASVLLVDALDSGSGAAIEANAESKGVKVIDYDRLVKGGPPDRVYVSFDNVNVGKLIGEGAVDCIGEWKVADPNVLVMSGDPTDNNAKLFAEGYNGVLQKYFDDGTYVNAGEPAGTWTPSEAATTFEQAYTDDPKINAAITPNDDNANAVIAQLQAKNIPAKTFPTTGQDASLTGLQNILKGYQCGTVYKPIYLEAQAAAALALYFRAGQDPPKDLINGSTDDSEAGAKVDSVLLRPTWVNTENMADTVVKDEAVNVTELCIAALQAACTEAGIS